MRSYRKRSPEDRFWAKVSRSDGCWEWTGPRWDTGYGTLNLGSGPGRQKRAHRFSYELHYGAIPEGLFVCHHCDNPPCVRPDHLFLGTCGDNIRDASIKGRLKGHGGRRVRRVLHPEVAYNARTGEFYFLPAVA